MINILADVISCTGTLTMVAVRGREELSDMVGKAVDRLEEPHHHEPLVECVYKIN